MEGQWDKEGNEIVEKLYKLLYPSLGNSLKDALADILRKATYFISFDDLTRYILITLEEKFQLPEKVKYALKLELEKIYKETQAKALSEVGIIFKPELSIPDFRAISYAEKLHDFYLGKFFRGDREIRLRIVKWFSKYYLEEGNPIGRGQAGIREFLDRFGEYIQPQTEWKVRQIIDTSVNFLRNSARIRAMQKARIKRYRWDAVGDRLTCKTCRSFDGRTWEVTEAVRILDAIESSEDPRAIVDYKPFVTTPYKGPSSQAPSRLPPLHPHCRCRIVAEIEEKEIPVTIERPVFAKDNPIQRDLEDEYRALSPKELENKIKAHLGSDWFRPVKGEKGINAYKSAKKEAERHFLKHGHEFGFKTPEEYYHSAYEVIKKPDEVYIERVKDKTFYIFRKGDKVVISSDDDLAIKTYFKLNKPFETFLKERKRDGLIKVL
jgi:SPP1 gp7 family putative phage head morphogenesis protein